MACPNGTSLDNWFLVHESSFEPRPVNESIHDAHHAWVAQYCVVHTITRAAGAIAIIAFGVLVSFRLWMLARKVHAKMRRLAWTFFTISSLASLHIVLCLCFDQATAASAIVLDIAVYCGLVVTVDLFCIIAHLAISSIDHGRQSSKGLKQFSRSRSSLNDRRLKYWHNGIARGYKRGCLFFYTLFAIAFFVLSITAENAGKNHLAIALLGYTAIAFVILLIIEREIVQYVRRMKMSLLSRLEAMDRDQNRSFKVRTATDLRIFDWFHRFEVFQACTLVSMFTITASCAWVFFLNVAPETLDSKYHFVWLLHLLSVGAAIVGALFAEMFFFKKASTKSNISKVTSSSSAKVAQHQLEATTFIASPSDPSSEPTCSN